MSFLFVSVLLGLWKTIVWFTLGKRQRLCKHQKDFCRNFCHRHAWLMLISLQIGSQECNDRKDKEIEMRSLIDFWQLGIASSINMFSFFPTLDQYCGDLKLGFFLSDNHLQVDIVSARNVSYCQSTTSNKPCKYFYDALFGFGISNIDYLIEQWHTKHILFIIPFYLVDTYVKTYLSEGIRRFLCRKTTISRQSMVYRQTVKYLSSDVPRRKLLAMLWVIEKKNHPSFEDYQLASVAGGGTMDVKDKAYWKENTEDECIGVVEVDIGKLINQQLVVGWYQLFNLNTYQTGSDSN